VIASLEERLTLGFVQEEEVHQQARMEYLDSKERAEYVEDSPRLESSKETLNLDGSVEEDGCGRGNCLVRTVRGVEWKYLRIDDVLRSDLHAL